MKKQSRKQSTADLRVYHGPSLSLVLYGFSVDMSSGGLFLKTETSFIVNEKVMLSFTLPEAETIVNCSARIAWINTKDEPIKPNLPAGVGLQFLDLPVEYSESIQSLLRCNKVSTVELPLAMQTSSI